MLGLHRYNLINIDLIMLHVSCLTAIILALCWLVADILLCYLQPQDAYGLEKLASEELAKHYDTDFGIECRIAR